MCIRDRDGYVYLYQDGVAAMVPVEVGLYDAEHAEILSGLSADDLVVSTWSSNLYEGARIQLRTCLLYTSRGTL